MSHALIIIDVQNDFCEGGALEVPGANEIIPLINNLIPQHSHVVATQDWHPAGHGSFASSWPGKKPFEKMDLFGLEQILWPDHCVQGTSGAKFFPDLDLDPAQVIFRKGMDPSIDSYSGFFDNGHRRSTGLSGYLRGLDVRELHFCGLAADYCVYYSILDALNEGFYCTLHEQATRAISATRYADIRLELQERGVAIIK